MSGAGSHVSTSNVELRLSKVSGGAIHPFVHMHMQNAVATWLRPSVRIGEKEGLTRYITIAMVDMMIWCPFFGTTTCLDDKGNLPFLFSFFFSFFSFLLIFFGGEVCTFKFKESVGAQEKRMKGTKGTNELHMLKWQNDRV